MAKLGTAPPWVQAAKTYLERQFESFEGQTLDQLVNHALQALHASLQVRLQQWCWVLSLCANSALVPGSPALGWSPTGWASGQPPAGLDALPAVQL